jgi:hypothetical protein
MSVWQLATDRWIAILVYLRIVGSYHMLFQYIQGSHGVFIAYWVISMDKLLLDGLHFDCLCCCIGERATVSELDTDV